MSKNLTKQLKQEQHEIVKQQLKDFTHEDILLLIDFVSNHPAIYQVDHPHYLNQKNTNLLYQQFLTENNLDGKYLGKKTLINNKPFTNKIKLSQM